MIDNAPPDHLDPIAQAIWTCIHASTYRDGFDRLHYGVQPKSRSVWATARGYKGIKATWLPDEQRALLTFGYARDYMSSKIFRRTD